MNEVVWISTDQFVRSEYVRDGTEIREFHDIMIRQNDVLQIGPADGNEDPWLGVPDVLRIFPEPP